MSIHKKLVLIFIAFSLLLITSMALLIKWSFHNSFGDYIAEQNQAHLQEISLRLGDYYEQHGSWSALQSNPHQIRQIIGRDLDDRPQPDHDDHPPPRTRPSLRLLFLLDNDYQRVLGRAPRVPDLDSLTPVQSRQQVVGYIGFNFNKRELNLRDERFAQRQARQLLLISLLAVILSLAFAWPLSRLLVRRINRLGRQIHHLGEGRYDQRIQDQGSDELADLARHLNHLARTLEQTEQSRRKWVADISHELRTPLATLRAQLEAIEDGIHPYNATTHQRLANQTLRLQQLVEDLYQLSLADVGALQYRKQQHLVQELIRDSAQPFVERFRKAGLELDIALHTTADQRLFVDSQRFQQLLTNLLENSLRYTNAPGTAQLSTTLDQGQLIISLQDSGPGVTEAQLGQLFERFYRGESSRNRGTGGAGLGLNICRSIVEAHGGTIAAQPSGLGGLNIIVSLPVDGT